MVLALLLHKQGVVSAPEQFYRDLVERRHRIPDILVVFQGLRTVIEGKVDDQPDAQDAALQAARDRVESGIAHISIGIVYPAQLRRAPSVAAVEEELAHTPLRIAICSEAGETGWNEGNIEYLADMLRRTFHQLVQEDVVAKAVEALNTGVNEFAHAALASATIVQKVVQMLDIGQPPRRARKEPEDAEE